MAVTQLHRELPAAAVVVTPQFHGEHYCSGASYAALGCERCCGMVCVCFKASKCHRALPAVTRLGTTLDFTQYGCRMKPDLRLAQQQLRSLNLHNTPLLVV